MTERSEPARSADWEEDTVPLSRPLTDTLELPAVSEAPPASPVAPQATPAPPPASAIAPQPSPVPPPATPAPPRPATPAPRPTPPPGRRPAGVRRWLVVAVVLLVGGTAVAGIGWLRRDAATGSGSVVPIRDVTSVDPSGGSGWRRSGSAAATAQWRTQHYRSATFGGLKSGVGLLIDLGERRRVNSVRTTVEVPGTTVELRAGNSADSAPDGFQRVDRVSSAEGRTTLDASDGGAHRYWLVWVPRLGQGDSGYTAELRGLTVRG